MRLAGASILALTAALAAGARAGEAEEFRAKRQEVFEFTRKPEVSRDGDKVTIRFASKAACDATVAIEDADGRIVRHLASGVLGANAPQPFRKGSLEQTLIWDGKDDQGRYVDARQTCAARVSLGLKARFERTLFWSPKRRVAQPNDLHRAAPVMVAAPEGIYVYEGGNADHLRLFDHDGNYLRTVYPFPSGRLEQVHGLTWQRFPQDGKRFPLKWGMSQNTLLTSARLDYGGRWPTGGSNAALAATALAVRGHRIALANARLNRMTTDGSSLRPPSAHAGRLTLAGPTTSFQVMERTYLGRKGPRQVGPRSAAISPDGEWLYLTGYHWPESWGTGGTRHRWLDGVARVRLDGQAGAAPEAFLGRMQSGAGGTDDRSFRAPLSVACDRKGRVYVADYMNDRVQVYRPDGTFLRTIRVAKPVHLVLDDKGDDLYVFSWLIVNPHLEKDPKQKVEPTLTRLRPLDDPRPVGAPRALPYGYAARWNVWDRLGGTQYRITLDAWTDPPRIWVAGVEGSWSGAQIRIYELQAGKLALKRDFAAEARRDVTWIRAPHYGRQRLYCNPRNGWLYVGEQHLPSTVVSKSIRDLVGIDPNTGEVRVVPLPFDAEDLAFDLRGRAYLRTTNFVARYETGAEPGAAWREVPFDYGEERRRIGNQGFRTTDVISGIAARGGSFVSGQLGGMSVSPKGHVAMTLDVRGKLDRRTDERNVHARNAKRYTPRIYPGRAVLWVVHVWDERGEVLYDDAVPGMGICSGLHLDRDDNLYVLASAQRLLAGEPYLNDAACTLLKVRPKAAKVLSSAGVVPLERRPQRPPDVKRWRPGLGAAWIEGAEWLYGGVGLDSHSIVAQVRHCHCEAISRPAFDHFDRSFLPEINRYDVVVVDRSGNTVVRIGRYGNVDDGLPLAPKGGPPAPRSIGGDEVALVHGSHLAVDTDRRLFVADLANARILSVKLEYHATERVPLK